MVLNKQVPTRGDQALLVCLQTLMVKPWVLLHVHNGFQSDQVTHISRCACHRPQDTLDLQVSLKRGLFTLLLLVSESFVKQQHKYFEIQIFFLVKLI